MKKNINLKKLIVSILYISSTPISDISTAVGISSRHVRKLTNNDWNAVKEVIIISTSNLKRLLV